MVAVDDLNAAGLRSLALELERSGLLGPESRLPLMNQLWARLSELHLPSGHAVELTRSFSQQLRQLCLDRCARPAQWLSALALGATHGLTAEQWQALSRLVAWYSGLVRLRQMLSEDLNQLPEALLQDLFQCALSRAELQAGLLASRWWLPGQPVPPPGWHVRHLCGGFRGWGGPFTRPPLLWRLPDGVGVQSGTEYWRLAFDCAGWHLACARPFAQAEAAEVLSAPIPGLCLPPPHEAVRLSDSLLISARFSFQLAICAWG